MKIRICLFLLLSTIYASSQEVVSLLPIDLENEGSVFQIVNKERKETTLFLTDKLQVKALWLSESMQLRDSLTSVRPEKNYDQMIGYIINTTNPQLFWSSSDRKELCSQHFDFEKKTVSTQKYNLEYKDEHFLQVYSSNDFFYILTVVQKSNLLRLYTFDTAGKMSTNTIDCGGLKFFTSTYKPTMLYNVLEKSQAAFESSFSLPLISDESPSSLSDTAKKRKCYFDNNKITLTLDIHPDYTQIIYIDVANYVATGKVIQQPFVLYDESWDYVYGNSFISNDRIFQIKTSSTKIAFAIKDLDGNLLKEYSVTDDKPIYFKNSEIIQESNDGFPPRTLNRSGQFLRKVHNLNLGLAVTRMNDQYLLTMGSVSETRISAAPAVIGGVLFGVAGGVAAALLTYAFYNPTYENFNSFKNRKVVYINCLFDQNGNHVDGTLAPMAFDRIRDFLDHYDGEKMETVYKLDSFYYLGFLNKKEKKYMICKFAE